MLSLCSTITSRKSDYFIDFEKSNKLACIRKSDFLFRKSVSMATFVFCFVKTIEKLVTKVPLTIWKDDLFYGF